MRLLHSASRTHAHFDDPNLVSCAGLVPVMCLAQGLWAGWPAGRTGGSGHLDRLQPGGEDQCDRGGDGHRRGLYRRPRRDPLWMLALFGVRVTRKVVFPGQGWLEGSWGPVLVGVRGGWQSPAVPEFR
jgi:hypothetical protein